MTNAIRERRVKSLRHDPVFLRWTREQRGLSQRGLAAAIGISPGHMCEIEAGTRSATDQMLTKLAEVLECPVSAIERRPTR